MAKVILREEAINDLNDIWVYTFERWSESQADKYYAAIKLSCMDLGTDPTIGKEYEGIRRNLLGIKSGKHIIFYNEFREFNKHRKEIVHYYQFETTYKHQLEENYRNEEEIEKLWNWKNNMPSYFKSHLNLSCIGFVKTYELIKTWSNNKAFVW
jgi:toxin ParE1/3/4